MDKAFIAYFFVLNNQPMLSENDIMELYSAYGEISAGNELFLEHAQVRNYNDTCYDNDFAIYRIEGFKKYGRMKQSRIDLIFLCACNYSGMTWIEFRKQCYEDTKKFFSNLQHEDNLVFSLFMMNESVWKLTFNSTE